MSYTTRGAKLLRSYTDKNPENVVWSPETGWADNDNTDKD